VDHETVPMRVLVAASNELPGEDAGLEALYDRMLLRLYLEPIQDKRNFKAMLTQKPMKNVSGSVKRVSNEEFEYWQKHINDVTLSEHCFELIYELKLFLEQKNTRGEMIEAPIYVSDRRWKKSMRLLQACAYFNGRTEVSETDLFILKDCIWHDLASREAINEAIYNFARHRFCAQQEVTQKIQKIRSKLTQLDSDFTDRFATRLVSEVMLTKIRYKLDTQSLQVESINGLPGMCKLAIIGEYDILEEGSNEKAKWLHVGLDDFQKQIRSGSCLIQGYVNDRVKSVWLNFSVNEHKHLFVHNFANKAIPIAMIKNNAVLNIRENWIQPLQASLQEVQEIESNITKNQHDFSSINKNIFVGHQHIEDVSKSLGALTISLNQVKSHKESLETRLYETAKLFKQEVVIES
ncbi:MAG: MoxR protein, partial [Psychromonas sp.]